MPSGTEALVGLEGAAVGYGRPLLREVTLRVGEGDYWGILGPNGGGKTTLVKTLLGVLKPLGGAAWRREGLRIGYVPQQAVLRDGLPLSAEQVVALGALGLRRTSPPREALSRLGVAALAQVPFASLSGGQRQRVLVARALHRRPELLVLDEPFNSVDFETRRRLVDILKEENRKGVAVLLVTHILPDIGPEMTRLLWLDGGAGLWLAGERSYVLSELERKAGWDGGAASAAGETEPVPAEETSPEGGRP